MQPVYIHHSWLHKQIQKPLCKHMHRTTHRPSMPSSYVILLPFLPHTSPCYSLNSQSSSTFRLLWSRPNLSSHPVLILLLKPLLAPLPPAPLFPTGTGLHKSSILCVCVKPNPSIFFPTSCFWKMALLKFYAQLQIFPCLC